MGGNTCGTSVWERLSEKGVGAAGENGYTRLRGAATEAGFPSVGLYPLEVVVLGHHHLIVEYDLFLLRPCPGLGSARMERFRPPYP